MAEPIKKAGDQPKEKQEKGPGVWLYILGAVFGLISLGAIVWLFITSKWELGTIVSVVILVFGLLVVIDFHQRK
jgi:hypothetical protein